MSDDPLTPHIEFLKARGYEIHSYSPGKDGLTSANLINHDTGVGARVAETGTTLYHVTRMMVTISTGDLQNSHPRFEMFERNMIEIVTALREKGIA